MATDWSLDESLASLTDDPWGGPVWSIPEDGRSDLQASVWKTVMG